MSKMKSLKILPKLFIAAALIVSSTALAQNRKAPPLPQNLPGATTEIYKTIGDVSLPIHIYVPDGHSSKKKAPAIIFFFGGGWSGGSPTQFVPHCKYLASRGMVAMTVEYRVASRHGVKAVSCVADAKSAMRWARQNAKRLGIDPDRIAAGGGSAGGHLAGSLGTISDFDEAYEDHSISSVPNALVLYNPALLLAPVDGKKSIPEQKLAQLEQRMGVSPKNVSPFHNLNAQLPPTVIFHGKTDTTVPYDSVELFTQKAKSLGNQCTLFGYDGQGHGFFNLKSSTEMFIETLSQTDKFLKSLGYLKGKPKVEAFLKSTN